MKCRKVPVQQVFLFVALLVLILIRSFFMDIKGVIDIANYIGMWIAFWGTWLKSIMKTEPKENRNISKGVLVFIMVLAVIVLVVAFVQLPNEFFPQTISDIFTLLAVMFCICEDIFGMGIRKIFRLKKK